jgi:hypothetical protein
LRRCAQQHARLMGEHVAVPGAALHRQRLRFEDANGLFEQAAQLGGILQRRIPVGLGLVDALARLCTEGSCGPLPGRRASAGFPAR